MNKGLTLAKEYASTIGLDLEYTFQETSQSFTPIVGKNAQGIDIVSIDPNQILQGITAKDSYKIVCLLYQNSGYNPMPTNPCQHPITKYGANPIQIPENWWVTFPEVLAQYFLHEISHSGFFFKGDVVNDITHNQHSYPEWQNKQPHEYYLHLLNGLKNFLEPSIPSKPSLPTLRIRSTDKASVRELQTLLNAKGASLLVDGDFGMKTLNALKKFQKEAGLTSDGVCGPKTWEALKKKQ